MLRLPFKSLTMLIVLWLAMLQVFAPFIHGHLELDDENQGHGLHMHAVDIEVPEMHTAAGHTLMGHAALHTVTVEHGLKNDQDLLIQAPTLALIFLLLLALPVGKRTFPAVPAPLAAHSPRYSPYLSRAPPVA
ncbi:MAG TPA: hypothetical protein VN023_07345 [Methylovorus sp.]|nr:hypothetical protein [Methylovorus sp.]